MSDNESRQKRSIAALRCCLLLILFAFTATEGRAHNLGESYLYLKIYSDSVSGRFEIALSDLNPALGLSRTDLEITDANLKQKMAAAHLLCMPFAYEGFGITTAEAMRCGVPVMGSTAGATRELITHGVNGLLLDPGDIAGVAAALSQLAADRERLHAMGRSAFERVQSHPSWHASMGQVEAFARRMGQH